MIPLLIAGSVMLVLFFSLTGIFNKFVKNRNILKDAWSNSDVQLKRRHDLIPNIVNITIE